MSFVIRRGNNLDGAGNAPNKHPVAAAKLFLPGSPFNLDGLPANRPDLPRRFLQLGSLLLQRPTGVRLVHRPFRPLQPVQQVRDTNLQFLARLLKHLCLGGFNGRQPGLRLGLLLARPDDIGGVAFLSGLWSKERMPQDPAVAGVRGKPVLQTHGCGDPLIPIAAARASRELLDELEVELTYREYDMGHQINSDCLRDLSDWLTARLDVD